jgi:uncharacterized protein
LRNVTPIRRWYRGSISPGRQSPLDLIMIQSTTFCNIKCKYCYLPNRDSKGRFPLELLEPLFAKLRRADLLDRDVTMLWHAGEPLSLPIDYYREAFAIIAEAAGDTRIMHNVQTNGMLLTDEYARFLSEQNVSVGLSIDGPDFLHDRMRVTRAGRPTLGKVLEGLECLKRAKVAFSVIAVLTAESLRHPGRIYEFFRDIGARQIGFNVDEAEGDYRSSSMTGDLGELFVNFLKHFYHLAARDGNRMKVRELDQGMDVLRGSMLSDSSASTNSESNPLSILNVDVEGNVSTFSPELIGHSAPQYDDFLFGNIRDIEFEALYQNPAFARLNGAIQDGVTRCKQSCAYFAVCGGGAPSNKWFENGSFDSTETMFCRFKKQHVMDALCDLVMETKERRSADLMAIS